MSPMKTVPARSRMGRTPPSFLSNTAQLTAARPGEVVVRVEINAAALGGGGGVFLRKARHARGAFFHRLPP